MRQIGEKWSTGHIPPIFPQSDLIYKVALTYSPPSPPLPTQHTQLTTKKNISLSYMLQKLNN